MGHPWKVCYYVTPHGLGHATRSLEVVKCLLASGTCEVTVVSGSAIGLFFHSQLTEQEMTRFNFRMRVFDSGALQPHAFTVDMNASLDEYMQLSETNREDQLLNETAWLVSARVDVVVTDAVPMPCQAAARAGITSVAVTNFSWDFVYSEYLAKHGADPRRHDMMRNIATDYASCNTLLRLPGFTPMPAFSRIIDVPLVVRAVRTPAAQVRAGLGIAEGDRVCVFMFGAHALTLEPQESWLPPGWVCVVCSGGKPLTPGGSLPPRFLMAAADAYVPDIVAASDCVLGKIGYGSVSECIMARTPLCFVRRDHFLEEPYLRKLLAEAGGAIEISRTDLVHGRWGPYLTQALQATVSYAHPVNGADVVAKHILDSAAEQQPPLSPQKSLVSFVMHGFELHGVRIREQMARTLTVAVQRPLVDGSGGEAWEVPKGLAVLSEGGLGLLATRSDTAAFAERLVQLADEDCWPASAEQLQRLLPEEAAASSLFVWGEPLTVTRAPGRCDVMGGFADYSGSLALQLPIELACHIALQLQSYTTARRWPNMLPTDSSSTERPFIRLVTLFADRENRSPSFNIYFDELMDGINPKPYAALHDLLTTQAASSWAAYVVGCLCVLMHEQGLRLQHCLAILISSDIPEGKGLASSAALEVALMQGLNIALDLKLDGEEVAQYCHKAENLVVGAPCGIMDQLVCSLGQEGELLAILCQPGQVVGRIPIPQGLKFWALDSGAYHSVAGDSYSRVRAAAFMGLQYVKKGVQEMQLLPPEKREQTRSIPPIQEPCYLADVSPSLWESGILKLTPEEVLGEDFERLMGSHKDPVTTIVAKHMYKVRAASAHPVYEHQRTQHARLLLESRHSAYDTSMTKTRACARDDGATFAAFGELMFQSHTGYQQCGLGSAGTDRLVMLARQGMVEGVLEDVQSIYGAKITGGGSGGCVCVATSNDECGQVAVCQIAARYAKATQHQPTIISGSSPGAHSFDHILLRIDQTPSPSEKE